MKMTRLVAALVGLLALAAFAADAAAMYLQMKAMDVPSVNKVLGNE